MDKFQWLNEMNRRFALLRDCQIKMVELAMGSQDADFLVAIKTAIDRESNELDGVVAFIDRVVVVPEKRTRTKPRKTV